MATLTPSAAIISKNESQQFTVAGITAPVWTLEGIGSLNQSGLYTAPNALGTAKIRAHNAFWNYFNPSYFDKNTNDTLTKNTERDGYYGQANSSGMLNAIGDYVEFVCHKNNPYWVGLEDDSFVHRAVFFANTQAFTVFHPAGNESIPCLLNINDVVRIEIVSGGNLQVTVNGTILGSTLRTFLNKNLRFTIDAYIDEGTIIKVPRLVASNYNEVEGVVTVQEQPQEIILNFTDPLVQYVPKNDLEAWFAADKHILDSEGLTLPDLSQNARHVSATSDLPVIQDSIINGFPSVYFNGSRSPLTHSGNITARHIFVVCAYDGATFTGYNGILSGPAHPVLEGQPSTSKFFDNDYELYGNYKYRKLDVLFAENNQQAKMNGGFAIYEIQYDAGMPLTGIQIGQDRNFLDRKWRGWFCETMMYSQVLSDLLREKIYYYFALKYQIWKQNADGVNIFPFFSNKTTNLERGKEVYLSEPYEGELKALVRGSQKRTFELPFLIRPQEEFVAAESFHAEHFPLQGFVFRDTRFYPPRNSVVRFTSNLKESGSDVTFRFNYSFNVTEL